MKGGTEMKIAVGTLLFTKRNMDVNARHYCKAKQLQ
jgi:hypothetical protein